MSLDGFIAAPDDDVSQLFRWYFAGDVPFPVGLHFTFQVGAASLPILQELMGSFGVLLTGRRDFEVSRAWGGAHPMGVPVVIVTHQPPAEWVGKPSPFTFVSEGVEAALSVARRLAGDKHIAVGGTTIVQQLLRLGLLDELHIDLVPLVLGKGIRLLDGFDHPIELACTRVIAGVGVTHQTFRVVR